MSRSSCADRGQVHRQGPPTRARRPRASRHRRRLSSSARAGLTPVGRGVAHPAADGPARHRHGRHLGAARGDRHAQPADAAWRARAPASTTPPGRWARCSAPPRIAVLIDSPDRRAGPRPAAPSPRRAPQQLPAVVRDPFSQAMSAGHAPSRRWFWCWACVAVLFFELPRTWPRGRRPSRHGRASRTSVSRLAGTSVFAEGPRRRGPRATARSPGRGPAAGRP